jgi:hypothetical protein
MSGRATNGSTGVKEEVNNGRSGTNEYGGGYRREHGATPS